MAAACRLIEIWGSPRDRGLRYGAAAEPEIRRGVKHYLDQMAASGLAEASVAELAEAYVPRIADFDADHVEEMRGIAEGDDVPLAHILLRHARPELPKLAGNPQLVHRAGRGDGREGVSTVKHRMS